MRNQTSEWRAVITVIIFLAVIFGLACTFFAQTPQKTARVIPVTFEAQGETVPWGVTRVEAPLIHQQNKGHGVKIAVLDTGIDLDHLDLRVAGNVTFVPETENGDDDNGHGTMVAGIIAALDNGEGIVGIAPEAEIYSVKVLNRNRVGTASAIIKGIEWAIANKMQIINMSLGTTNGLPEALVQALEKAHRAGIVLVSGAGNSGDQGNIYSPARYEQVIAVGATDESDLKAAFSNTGSALELMAPGTNVLTTTYDGGYGAGPGTSFAAPLDTGAAALLVAAGVTDNATVRHILTSTARDLGDSGKDDRYGYGLVDAAEALRVVSLPD